MVEYNTPLDGWQRYSQILSEFKVDAEYYCDNKAWFKKKLYINIFEQQVESAAQLDPHQAQLIFPSDSVNIAKQALKQTQDELYPQSYQFADSDI